MTFAKQQGDGRFHRGSVMRKIEARSLAHLTKPISSLAVVEVALKVRGRAERPGA